nr:hypothetical protein CFP56_50376 [Quercus suber]
MDQGESRSSDYEDGLDFGWVTHHVVADQSSHFRSTHMASRIDREKVQPECAPLSVLVFLEIRIFPRKFPPGPSAATSECGSVRNHRCLSYGIQESAQTLWKKKRQRPNSRPPRRVDHVHHRKRGHIPCLRLGLVRKSNTHVCHSHLRTFPTVRQARSGSLENAQACQNWASPVPMQVTIVRPSRPGEWEPEKRRRKKGAGEDEEQRFSQKRYRGGLWSSVVGHVAADQKKRHFFSRLIASRPKSTKKKQKSIDSPEADYGLEPTAIDTQIGIPKQFLLHERTQRSAFPFDPRGLLQIRPVVQGIVVDVVDDVLEIQAGERVDQRGLEPGLHPEHLLHELRHRPLRRVALIHHVEDDPLSGRRIGDLGVGRAPLRRRPQRACRVFHVQRVGAQPAAPQPLQRLLGLAALVDARERELQAQPLAGVRAVDMRQPQHAQVQPGDLRELLLRRQLPLRLLRVRLARLVALLLWRLVRVVHGARADLDEGLDAAPCGFLADRDAQLVTAQLVHLILLREARLPAAVEDIIELALGAVGARGQVKDARLGLLARGVGLKEVGVGAGEFVLGRKRGELWELLVDQSQGGREVVGVDVVRQESANVPCRLWISAAPRRRTMRCMLEGIAYLAPR